MTYLYIQYSSISAKSGPNMILITRPPLLYHIPRLAFVDFARSQRPFPAQLCFVLFGPYSPFTTLATSSSHPDYSLPRALHVGQKRPTFVWDVWAPVAILLVDSHPFLFGPLGGQKCCIAWSGPQSVKIAGCGKVRISLRLAAPTLKVQQKRD